MKPKTKVIYFPTHPPPKMGWVVNNNLYYVETRNELRISFNEVDRDEGKGAWYKKKDIKLWTPELWARCEEYMERIKEIEEQYKELRTGKEIMERPDLFGGENKQ